MSHQDEINELIRANNRRLQKLKVQRAKQGHSVDPKIVIEIEDIETELQELKAELKKIEDEGISSSPLTTSRDPHETSQRATNINDSFVSKEGPGTGGDVISVSNVGSGVAAGRGAKAQVFNIDIRDIHWWPVIIALVGMIGLLAFLFLQLRPSKPEKMQGLFNVAVAEFLVQDQNGNRIDSDDGTRLADYLSQQIETNFKELELQKSVGYDVWGPEDTGPILGNTRAVRAQAAKDKATKIGAHIIIYGYLTENGDRSSFAPEFFVNHTSFQEAEELGGQHELGSALRLSLPLAEQILGIDNPALVGRAHALTLITLGLAYYSIDDFENAILYFGKAADDPRWLPTAGKEVVHLLLGNAYIRLESNNRPRQFLDDASTHYESALDINPGYGRAKVGLANVLILSALRGDPPGSSIDLALLDDATNLLEEASQLQNQAESANLKTKAHYYFGKIALTRYLNDPTGTEDLVQARNEFNLVIQDFEAGAEGVKELAAHSYAHLGFIAGAQNSFDLAIEHLHKAVDYASPFYKGEYSTWLANYHAENHQWDLAEEAFEEAIVIAETNSDLEMVELYKKQLEYLLSRRP